MGLGAGQCVMKVLTMIQGCVCVRKIVSMVGVCDCCYYFLLYLFPLALRRLPGLMSQQKQTLHLTQDRKCPGGPTSPSAAKRLYRNLSEKLRGSTSSFEDTHFFGKMDRLRQGSVSV